MALPVLSHTAGRLYDALAPLAARDERYGYALAHLQAAIAVPLDEPADLSRDLDDGRPGWSILFDLDNVAPKFLPYTGQFLGVDVPGYLSVPAQRLRIRETAGFRRGSPGAVLGAARQTLVGPDGTPDTATVYMVERHGSAYRLTVSTLASETPDPDWTLREVLAQTPGGIIADHELIGGGDFGDLRDTHTDFQDVASTFADFSEVRSNPTKQ